MTARRDLSRDERVMLEAIGRQPVDRGKLTRPDVLALVADRGLADPEATLDALIAFPSLVTDFEGIAPAGHRHTLTPRGHLALLDDAPDAAA